MLHFVYYTVNIPCQNPLEMKEITYFCYGNPITLYQSPLHLHIFRVAAKRDGICLSAHLQSERLRVAHIEHHSIRIGLSSTFSVP